MDPCPWGAYAPATTQFCERRLCAWIAEPANTWSNLAYFCIGFWILWLNRHRRRSVLSAVGVTALLVGFGSFAFHATGTFVGEVLDFSAMYLIGGLFVVCNVRRLWRWSDRAVLVLYVAISVASSALLVASRVTGIPVFIVQVVVAGSMELVLYRRHAGITEVRHLQLLIGFFVAAFSAWSLDITGLVCDPDNHLFTGHALWHVANSFCLLWFYRHHEQFEPSLGASDYRTTPGR